METGRRFWRRRRRFSRRGRRFLRREGRGGVGFLLSLLETRCWCRCWCWFGEGIKLVVFCYCSCCGRCRCRWWRGRGLGFVMFRRSFAVDKWLRGVIIGIRWRLSATCRPHLPAPLSMHRRFLVTHPQFGHLSLHPGQYSSSFGHPSPHVDHPSPCLFAFFAGECWVLRDLAPDL